MQYQFNISLSKNAWPLKIPYKFVDWENVNQLEKNTLIDLIGRVTTQPVRVPNDSIQQLDVIASDGDME